MLSYKTDLLVTSIFNWSLIVVSLLILIYGVTSWCLIKKFRTFKNYAYINAILAAWLRILVTTVDKLSLFSKENAFNNTIFDFIFGYLMTVQWSWLVVICYIFYMEIVKVFNMEIRRKFLKSTIVTWVLALFTTAYVTVQLIYFWDSVFLFSLSIIIVALPLIINVVLYFFIIGSLCCCSRGNASTTGNCRRFYIATLIFIFSDLIIFFGIALTEVVNTLYIVDALLSCSQIIILDVFLPLLRSNRELWREYFRRRLANDF